MGQFVNNKWAKWFAIVMGFILIAINASGLIPLGLDWWAYVLIAIGFIIYLGMIIIVIRAPIFELKDITEDDEYAKEDAAKIVVDDTYST